MDSSINSRSREIVASEIELLKCVKARDYKNWLKIHQNELDNPHVATALQKYDDVYYYEHNTFSGAQKYLIKFPQGRHREEAKAKISNLEWEKKLKDGKNDEILENVGCGIIAVIFLTVLLYPMIAKGWNIGETFMLAGSFTPLYWIIHNITKKD